MVLTTLSGRTRSIHAVNPSPLSVSTSRATYRFFTDMIKSQVLTSKDFGCIYCRQSFIKYDRLRRSFYSHGLSVFFVVVFFCFFRGGATTTLACEPKTSSLGRSSVPVYIILHLFEDKDSEERMSCMSV